MVDNRAVRIKATAEFLLALLFFGSIGIVRRHVAIPSGFMSFFRGVVGSLVTLALLYARGGRLRYPSRRVLILLMISGMCIGVNWVLLFEAYKCASISVGTLCNYMAPLIVIIYSCTVYKEKISVVKALAVLVAVLGMTLVCGIFDGNASASAKGIAFGLGSAVFFAIDLLVNKRIDGVESGSRTFVQMLFAGLVALPYTVVAERPDLLSVDAVSWWCLIVLAVVHTGIVYVLYFDAMAKLSTQSVAILGYVDPVFAVLLSALILGERLSLYGIAGVVLVISSLVVAENS